MVMEEVGRVALGGVGGGVAAAGDWIQDKRRLHHGEREERLSLVVHVCAYVCSIVLLANCAPFHRCRRIRGCRAPSLARSAIGGSAGGNVTNMF